MKQYLTALVGYLRRYYLLPAKLVGDQVVCQATFDRGCRLTISVTEERGEPIFRVEELCDWSRPIHAPSLRTWDFLIADPDTLPQILRRVICQDYGDICLDFDTLSVEKCSGAEIERRAKAEMTSPERARQLRHVLDLKKPTKPTVPVHNEPSDAELQEFLDNLE